MPAPTTRTIATWTSVQAYMLAVISLVLGIAIGYIVRGSASSESTSATQAATSTGGATIPSSPGMSGMQQPNPEQMKKMADTQAQQLISQLSSRPNDSALLTQIGNVYYDSQQYKEAITYYEKAFKLDPQNSNLGTDLGTAYYYSGDNDRAVQQLNAVLKTAPNHPQALFNLGIVKWQGKMDIQGASEAWQKLLDTNPNYPERDKVEGLLSQVKKHENVQPGQKAGPLPN
jgi:cytochrome c-type biogenesis protein CcmH/NrfG